MGIPTASVADHNAVGWRLDNTYARLPDTFFAPASPATFPEPRVSVLNHRLAGELGLDLGALAPEAAAALFAGQSLPAGSGRSPRRTRGTSSAASRCSATAAPSCWASTARI